MDTPPYVENDQVVRTIARIRKRRLSVDDPNAGRIPIEPLGVLDYLRRYSSTGIPRWVLQAEALDAATLVNHLHWQMRSAQLWTLKRAVGMGHHLSTIGSEFGIKTRQGTQDRIDRLDALLMRGKPDAEVMRDRRRSNRERELMGDVENAWIAANERRLVDIAVEMNALADLFNLPDDGREWIDEVRTYSRDGFTPGAMGAPLAFAVEELQALLPTEGEGERRLNWTVREANLLRAEFSALGKEAAKQSPKG